MLGNDYKHPVVLAREAATLDLLSDGRLELGIGAGWMTVDYEKAGIAARLGPACASRGSPSRSRSSRACSADGPFTFHGEHYRVTDLDGQPKPVQRPHPPFIVGGGGPKILALAAREAQIVGINANLRSGDGNIAGRRAVAHVGRDRPEARVRCATRPATRFDDLEIQTLVGFVHVADDTRGDRRRDRAARSASIADDAHMAPVTLVGSESEIVDLLERRRERWQMSYVVVARRRHRRMRADRRASGRYLRH